LFERGGLVSFNLPSMMLEVGVATTSYIGPFTRITYFGPLGFRDLSLDIVKFKTRRAEKIDRQRYWTERWDSIKGGVQKCLDSRGHWVVAIRYEVPGDKSNINNHTTLFLVTPGCNTPAELASDAQVREDLWNPQRNRDDIKALSLFPDIALQGHQMGLPTTSVNPPERYVPPARF
jgi:hypothetical protein